MSANRTQHVLDAIDGALNDWTVSGDAMRWAPDTVRAPRQNGRGLRPAPIGRAHLLVDGGVPVVWQGVALTEVFGVAFREAAEAVARLFEMSAGATASMAGLLEQLAADDDEFAQVSLDEWEQVAVDARARALQLRRERNTGPGKLTAGQQKRPRRHGTP